MEGLQERIRHGKLHLQLREFLALMLKNYTGIQVTRLDVFTQAGQITSAQSVFDPRLNFNFSAVRSISPLSYSISGSPNGGQSAASAAHATADHFQAKRGDDFGHDSADSIAVLAGGSGARDDSSKPAGRGAGA